MNQVPGDEGRVQRVLDLMTEAGRTIQQLTPEGAQPPLSKGEELVAALHFGCVGLYKSMFLLLNDYLSEEARILSRTLMYDTITLVYFQGKRRDLEALAMRFVYSSIREEIGMWRSGIALGWSDYEQQLSVTERHRDELRAIARSEGVALQPLPSAEQMLKDMGQGSAHILIERAHRSVHTSRFSLAARVDESEEGHVRFRVTGVPDEIVRVGALAIEMHMAEASATAHILNWPTAQELLEVQTDVRARLATLFPANSANE